MSDAALVERERVEQAELGRRQLGALAVDVGLHVARVEPQLLDVDLVAASWLLRAGAAPRGARDTRATSSFIENGFTR